MQCNLEEDTRTRAYHLSKRSDRRAKSPEENWLQAEREMSSKHRLKTPAGQFLPFSQKLLHESDTDWAKRAWANDKVRIQRTAGADFKYHTLAGSPGWAFEIEMVVGAKPPGCSPVLHLHKEVPGSWYNGRIKKAHRDHQGQDYMPPADMVDTAASLIPRTDPDAIT